MQRYGKMNDRMSTAEYRAFLASSKTAAPGVAATKSKRPGRSSPRLSVDQYLDMLSGHGQCKTPVSIPVSPKPGILLETEKSKENRLDRVIRSINESVIHGEYSDGTNLKFVWQGMQLLSLNELLRLDHRKIHAYRHACHRAVVYALSNFGCAQPTMMPGAVHVTLYRTGKKLVDADGLYASFKFLIDGFRMARIIIDDNPNIVSRLEHEQKKGSPEIGVSIRLLATAC